MASSNGTTAKGSEKRTCKVTRRDDYLEVLSPTGKALRAETEDEGLSPAEVDLLNSLLPACGFGTEDRDLTLDQMAAFRALVEGQRARSPQAKEKASTDGKVGEYVRSQGNKGARFQAQNSMEQNILGLENALTALKGRLWRFGYDIASSLDSEVPNPSSVLWHCGFCRLENSEWIGTDKAVQSQEFKALLKEWERYPNSRRNGIKRSLYPFDPSATEEIQRDIQEALREYLVAAHTSLIKRIDDTDKRLLDAQTVTGEHRAPTQRELERAQMLWDTNMKTIFREAIERLDQAISAARAFDDSAGTLELIRALRDTTKAQVAAYNAQMAARRKRGLVDPIPAP